MQVLLIDDNTTLREGLELLLRNYCPQIEVINQANSLQTGLQAIKKYEPNLVFLDVELGDGTGIELLEKIGNPDFHVVFVTAHDKYAVDAFRLSAVDFLLKPIDPEELIKSIQKVEQRIRSDQTRLHYEVLRQNLRPDTEKRIILKTQESIHFIKVSDIIRCESSGAYTTFILVGQKDIVTSKGIKNYDALLRDFGFIRTHQSHLVNVRKITRIDKADGGAIIMENEDMVPISQRKRETVMQLLEEL
ncbi:MAG: LytTR family DNA-binding domain-containing protein [Bacteroidota bacterium]